MREPVDPDAIVRHAREVGDAPSKSSIGVVLSRAYVVGSVMLWVAYFMGLVIFYALINWMPTLFRDEIVCDGNTRRGCAQLAQRGT